MKLVDLPPGEPNEDSSAPDVIAVPATTHARSDWCASWRIATWVVPFTTQCVLGLMLLIWQLQEQIFPTKPQADLVAWPGKVLASAVAAAVGIVFATRVSPRIRGFGIALVASALIVFIGLAILDYIYLDWMS